MAPAPRRLANLMPSHIAMRELDAYPRLSGLAKADGDDCRSAGGEPQVIQPGPDET